MIVDADALCDRLYGDAVAVGLRYPLSFCNARTTTTWKEVETRVRERAQEHAIDLSATAASVERALEEVHRQWQEIANEDSILREIDLVSRVARKLLRPDGRDLTLQVDREHPGREILRWRFVSLALPPAILIAAAAESGFVAPGAVRILNASIAPDSPVAQNHLHHAALPTFEELWASLRIRALTQPGEFARAMQDSRAYCPGLHRGACPGSKAGDKETLTPGERIARVKHMAEWADIIRQAFIARRVIDHHSWHRDDLTDCADSICNAGWTVLQEFAMGQTKRYSLLGTPYPWPAEAISMARDHREVSASTAGRRLAGVSVDLLAEESARERRLLARGFELSRLAKNGDQAYEKLFLQYLRVKTAVFRQLVHSPGEHGLAKFLQYFTQIKVYAPESDKLKPRRPSEAGLSVRATEYRVAPDAWLQTLRHDREIEEQKEGSEDEPAPPENGWIIHFKRKGPGELLPLYGEQRRSIEGEAQKIANALVQKPERLRLLRGIDICGVEGKQPLWVSAQTLLWLRNRSRETAASRPGLKLEPLKLTLHAGEDFTWLTSGMRAVAEPFRWNLIERGDRIGHGIAVTLDPHGWWHRHKGEVVEVTRFDRLLDLAFLCKYSRGRNAQQSEWLRRETEIIANDLWPGMKGTHEDLILTAKEAWRHLGLPTTRRLMDSSNLHRPPDRGDVVGIGEPAVQKPPLHEEWIYKYLWDRGTQKRACEIIYMKVDDDSGSKTGNAIEMDLLAEARAKLITEIALWQVCIESNPSSNLVIASLDSMASQDFLQIRPTTIARKGAETLTWTISTDNPITFSTSLADEYAYAWAGMVLRKDKPYDPSYARALLDEAAATSMRMRFTLPPYCDRERTNRPNR